MRTRLLLAVAVVFTASSVRAQVPLVWFYTEGCRRCDQVRALVGKLEQRYADRLRIERLEITAPANYRRLMGMERRHGVTQSHPMSVFVGNAYFLGHREILKHLEPSLPDILAETESTGPRGIEVSPAAKPATGAPDDFAHMRPVLVMCAGLVDGVNPCAFASVIFLISVLASRRTRRGETLGAGLAFCGGVFASYFLMGFGAFTAIHRLQAFRSIAEAFYWCIVGGVLVLGLVSLRDAWLYRKTGRAADLMIRVPNAWRNGMHRVLRGGVGVRCLVAGCFAAGAVVSVLELVCTGQIYLPTIIVMIQDPAARTAGTWYLALYNMAFVLPLLVVVVVFVLGVRLERFLRFSRRSVTFSKVLLALFFFILAGVLIALRR